MKFSVALCTYNGEKYIEEQLVSILNQDLAVDEIIVCDDYSSDNTLVLLNKISVNYPGRIKVYRNEQNIGAIGSFEKCIKLCQGDIIFLSDQDDIWMPNKVETLISLFQKDEKALAAFSDGHLISEAGQLLEGSLWYKWGFTVGLQHQWRNNDFAFIELLQNHNKITGATLAFKRELMSNLFPVQLPISYWHDCWIGLVAAGLGGLRFISEPTIKYRIHNQQQVGLAAGGIDKKFSYVSYDTFLAKVVRNFPNKIKLIYSSNQVTIAHLLKILLKKFRN